MTQIDTTVWKDIEQHGEATFPYECCGFLYGKDSADGRSILASSRVENVQEENRERRFSIAPSDYSEAERQAQALGLDLIGIYHSHPDHPAIASETDRASAMPFFSYVIVSVIQGKAADMRSWILDEQFQFQEEKIEKSQDHTYIKS